MIVRLIIRQNLHSHYKPPLACYKAFKRSILFRGLQTDWKEKWPPVPNKLFLSMILTGNSNNK